MVSQNSFSLKAKRVVLPSGVTSATVVVQDEKITQIAPYQAEQIGEVVEIPHDSVLLPGFIDAHVHINEPGRTNWEGFETATRAGAAGGITTIIDMPLNSLPPTIDAEALRQKKAAAMGKLSTDVGFWGGAVPGNTADMAELWDQGVFGFKCFLADSGVSEFCYLDIAQLTEHMREIAKFDGLLIVHAEDAKTLNQAEPAGASYQSFLKSRPHEAEDIAISKLIAAIRETGCRTHILHLSSAWSLPQIALAKQEGLPLTAETCTHYLFFDSEQIPQGHTEFKCCPPLREPDNRERLWEGIFNGTIDYVASDHSPCVAELKRLDLGDFGKAWGGISSVQLGPNAIWTELKRRGGSLNDLVRLWCTKPADVLGIPDRGAIAAGNYANFCVFSPDKQFTVDVKALHHRNQLTPYHGVQLDGVVEETWLRGEKVDLYSPRGHFITR